MNSFGGRPGIMSWVRMLALTCMALWVLPAQAGDLEQELTFSIPSQPLSSALLQFGQQTKIQVLTASPQLSGVKSAGAEGHMSARAALEAILSGSGLSYREVGQSTVTIGSNNSNSASAGSPPPESPQSAVSGQRLAQADSNSAQSDSSVEKESREQISQRESVRLEEVLVTAQKKSERLQDVPVPVSVLDVNSLAQNNQNRLEDYFATVPGLSMSPAGGGEQTIAIRGITTTFDSNPTVGVVIDDVPYGSSTIGAYGGLLYPDLDPGDLARIEVLRGPQGTLYGASSLGGLIKFVTQDPSTEAVTGRVQILGDGVQHGDAGWGVRAGVNIPLSETWAIRASGFSRRDPGYIDNVTTGGKYTNRTDAYGGRLAMLWRPSDALSVKLSGLLQNTETDGNSVVNTNSFFQPVMGNYQVTGIRGDGSSTAEVRQFSAALNARLGNLTLTSISGYGDNTWRQINDFSQFFSSSAQSQYGVSGSLGVQQYETKRVTQELRLASPGGQLLDWIVGAFYSHENGPGYQNYGANAVPSGSFAGPLLNIAYPTTVVSEYAGFGDLTVNFTDRLDLQLGARESTYRQTYQEIETGPLVLDSLYLGPTLRSSGNAFTYLLTPRFRISPDLMVYARVASGYRIGGPNPTQPEVDTPASFKPDKTTNYEVGVKGNVLNRSLSFEASAYYIDWKDIQLSQFYPQGGGFTYDINGGGAKSEGIEVSVTTRPMPKLSISAEATFDNAVLTQNLPPATTAYALAGDRLPFTSRFSGSLSADYDVVSVGNARGFTGASVSYVGTRLGEFSGDNVTPRFRYPAYAKTNAHAGVRYNSWLFNLFVNNITDRRGITGGGNAFQVGNTLGYQAQIIQPRLVGLSITKTFGD